MTVVVPVDQERDVSCLGASEAPGVLGLDKYNPPIKVWRRHRGLEVKDDLPGNIREAAEWGNLHEPIVRGKYALMTRSIVEVPYSSSVRDGWLRCTPDGFVYAFGAAATPHVFGGSEPRNTWFPEHRVGLVQCKTAAEYLDYEWSDGPPPRYEVQCRVEMAVTALPWCDIICLVGGNRLRGPFRITRDLDIESRIVRDLQKFWNMVQLGIEPTVDDTDAWRLHVSEKMRETKLVLQADHDVRELLAELRTLKVAQEANKARIKTTVNRLLLHLSARGAQAIFDPALGRFPAVRAGGGMDWKGYAEMIERQLVKDGAAHASELADQRDRFKRPATTWSLRTPRGFTGEDDE